MIEQESIDETTPPKRKQKAYVSIVVLEKQEKARLLVRNVGISKQRRLKKQESVCMKWDCASVARN
jgi:hypothetical protein